MQILTPVKCAACESAGYMFKLENDTHTHTHSGGRQRMNYGRQGRTNEVEAGEVKAGTKQCNWLDQDETEQQDV